MTTPSTSHTRARRFMRSAKSTWAVAALALVHVHTNAQMVMNLPTDGILSLPILGTDGEPIQVRFSEGAADTVFGSGSYATTGNIETLGGALTAINVPNLQVGGLSGTSIREQFGIDVFGESARTYLASSTAISSLDIRTNASSAPTIEALNFAGGLTMSGTQIRSVLSGGSLQIDQIRANLAAGQVFADLSGTRAAIGTKPAVTYDAPNTVMWTFDPVASLAVPLAPNTIHTQINDLALTPAGATFLSNALGLLSISQDALNAANNSPGKWGSISASMAFSTVPEPSTYALMGIGLVGIALVARRKTPSV